MTKAAGRARLRRITGRFSLRVKLVATVLALAAVALGAADIAATAALRGYLLGRVDTQLKSTAAPIIAAAERGAQPQPRDARPGRERFHPPSDYYIALADPNGNVTDQLNEPLAAGQSPPKLPRLTPQQAAARHQSAVTIGDWRVLIVPFSDRSGSLWVATNLGDLNGTLARLGFLEVFTGLVVLVLLGGLGYLLVGRSLRPLEEVERTAAAIAAGDLSRRVPDHPSGTEVGRLSAALNGMLAQIEAAFGVRQASETAARASEQRMRRFVTDASHELRTPLTSIRGFAELYRQGAAADTQDVARYMRRIEDAAARMGLLVDDLLLLARLDQQRPLERAPVDLLAVASDTVHDARAMSPGRPVRLQVIDGPAAPVVMGDDSRLRQVLGNLVSNALTHTPDGTPVSVRVGTRIDPQTGDLAAMLEVIDEGPGLPADQAELVFERFYRADPSRTRGGTGLGLSIVAALTSAHGGRVEVDTRPGNGATFRVVLPVADSAGQTTPAAAEPSGAASER